jgi:phage/plasmid-like protein (TIGR03299 family)
MSLRELFPRLPHEVGTIDELLKTIGADFEVEKRAIYQRIPSGGFTPVIGWSATARKDTDAALGVVGSRYGVSQYKHTLGFLDELVADGQFRFNGGRTTLDGAHLYVSLVSPSRVIFGGNDTVDCHFTVSTSHDGSDSIRVMCSPVHSRSQTVLPSKLGIVKIRHSVHVGRRLADAAATLRKMNKVWEQHKDAFERFPQIQLSNDDAKTYFAMLAPAKSGSEVPTRTQNVRDQLMSIYTNHKLTANLPSCKGTLLGALVAAMIFGDYYKTVRKSIVGVSEQDARIESRLNGQGAKLKADAFAGALELMRLDNEGIFAPIPGITGKP